MIQNHQNCDVFSVEFLDLSGAKDRKSCRQMLKNAPTLAIVAVDTEENEPLKILGDLFRYSVRSLVEPRGEGLVLGFRRHLGPKK